MVACSDGRLQEAVDDFLSNVLGVTEYDRLYLPGGPGTLASSGLEYARTDRMRKEFRFLLEVHEIEEVILIFHGAAPDGPKESICADYARFVPNPTRDRVLAEQENDAREILSREVGFSKARIRVFFAEVDSGQNVGFREFDPHIMPVQR